MKEEDILKEAHEIDQEKHFPKKKSPLWYILGIFLALLLVVMIVPSYSIRMDPHPSQIPTIDDVVRDVEIDSDYAESITLDMIDGSDPLVKEVADRIASIACESGQRVCQAKAMFYFVRDNFDYVSDPNSVEYVKNARQSLMVRGGDCEDGSLLVASLLDAIGIRWRLVFIPRHVYVEILLPGALNRYEQENGWIPLEVTCKNCKFGELPYQNVDKPKTYLPN